MIDIRKGIADLRDEVVAVRRRIHSNPEPGMEEFRTSRMANEYFTNLGADVDVGMFGTAVIVNLKGNSGEKCYAFRADMDALPIQEETGLEFASANQGMMHACGHDAHTAILMGFGKYLIQNKERLAHHVRLIFQPAEEGPGGALPLVQAGVLDNPQVNGIIGLHLSPEVEEGKVGVRPGPVMAQTGEVYIDVRGQRGHGAQPHKGKDALVAACHMVVAYQTIVSRWIDPVDSAVFTLGRIEAGEKLNIIAENARIEGTIRAFTEENFDLIKERIMLITKGVGDSFGCETRVEFSSGYPPVNNDSGLFRIVAEAVGKGDVEDIKPVMLAEDFSHYQKYVPGLFFMLGVRNHEKGYVHPLHSSKFDFNEDVMMTGIEVYSRILEKLGGLRCID